MGFRQKLVTSASSTTTREFRAARRRARRVFGSAVKPKFRVCILRNECKVDSHCRHAQKNAGALVKGSRTMAGRPGPLSGPMTTVQEVGAPHHFEVHTQAGREREGVATAVGARAQKDRDKADADRPCMIGEQSGHVGERGGGIGSFWDGLPVWH